MHCLHNRLQSFGKPVRLQNAAKTGAWRNIKWPHPDSFLANPTALADAGFYYSPSFEERDSVTCFFCDKEIADWDADDDPYDIHWTKCSKTCPWAIVRCGLKADLVNGRFTFSNKNRLPTSKAMEKARLQTYSVGDGWIHDRTKNHGASSKKMAKAGFVFTPQHVDDDLATCLYCGISLSSWDADDDPLEEHQKRGSSCAFFSGSSSSSKLNSQTSVASTRSTTARGRARSTMQDIIEDTIEPLAPPAKVSTAKRKVSKAPMKSVAAAISDDEDYDEPSTSIKRTSARTSRTSKKSVILISDIEDDEEVAAGTEKSKKTGVETTTKAQTSFDMDADVEMDIPDSSEPEHISFAPRLVVKTDPRQEQMRFKTPELEPIDVEDTIMLPKTQFEVEEVYESEVNTPRMPFTNFIPTSPRATSPAPAPAPDTAAISTTTSVESLPQLPSTPQRRQPQPPLPQESKQPQREASLPTFVPFLSKLPFTPFVTLSDAELDMIVEEWIRYQMEVEFDKFKRDGERELVRFRKRAEEVRKVIEGL